MADAHHRFQRRNVRLLLVLLVAALGVIAWLLLAPSPRVQFGRLTPAQRDGLYTRALTDLQEVCTGPAAGDLAAHCQHQAALVVQMPECDPACRKLAEPWLRSPSR